MDDKSKVDEAIMGQQIGRNFTDSVERAPDLRLLWTLHRRAEGLISRVTSYKRHLRTRTSGQYAVISLILLGMVAFFTALILQVVITQSGAFWIPFVGLVAIMGIFLGGSTIHAQYRSTPGFWKSLRRDSASDVEPNETPTRSEWF
jgi:hypothetical protein